MSRTILPSRRRRYGSDGRRAGVRAAGHGRDPEARRDRRPGESITLRTAAGAPVRTLRAGVYTVVVKDRSDEHNFRIVGPGVNKATSVGSTGTVTWKVKLVRGKGYRFQCDPHSDDMRGAFRAR